MPRSSGTYSAPASSWSPAVSGNAANFGDWNTLLADLSSALTQSLSQDGQTNPTANLPMAGFKHTGVGNASGTGQYIAWGQNCTLGTVTVSGMVGDGSGLTALSATSLTTGTIPDARFPATLPAVSGVNLTALNASNLGSGTVPNARFPATLPAASAANLTSIPAAQLTGDIAAARMATNLNASGSAPFYVARAWINFNGTSTPTAIGTPGNMLTSITDNGAGDYTLFFDVDMPNADYVMAGSATGGVAGQGVIVNYRSTGSTVAPTSKTTSECRIRTSDVDSGEDAAYISVVFFC